MAIYELEVTCSEGSHLFACATYGEAIRKAENSVRVLTCVNTALGIQYTSTVGGEARNVVYTVPTNGQTRIVAFANILVAD